MARNANFEQGAPTESAALDASSNLSAAEAQSLLRMLLPLQEYDRSYSNVMLLPAVDGSRLYMRNY